MRLFIATSFPRDVLGEVNDRVARVKTRLPPSSWVRAESQHLTYAFLGEQHEALVAKLGPLLRGQVSAISSFEARLRGCGFFPNSRRPRVGWIGATPHEKFEEVAGAVRAAVKAAGAEFEGGRFNAHLTLCRIRDSWPPASIEIFNGTFGDIESAAFEVDHVMLYSSRLNPAGAIHTPLRKFALA